MPPKVPTDTSSPTASSAAKSREPSRRGSIASLRTRPTVDLEKDLFLDRVHTTASRSDALTTFDDFTPPRPGSKGEAKAFAGEIVQGGFSGLYNRFKASVGAAKDAVAGAAGNDSADDASIRSGKGKAPASQASGPTTLISPTTASASSSRMQSPLIAKFPDAHLGTAYPPTSSSVSVQSKATSSTPSASLQQQTRAASRSSDASDSLSRGEGNTGAQRDDDLRQNRAFSQSTGSVPSPVLNPIKHSNHVDRDSLYDGSVRTQDTPGLLPSSKNTNRTVLQSVGNVQADSLRRDGRNTDVGSSFTDRSDMNKDPEQTPRAPNEKQAPRPTLLIDNPSGATSKPIPQPIATQSLPSFQEPHTISNFKIDTLQEPYSSYQRPPLIQVSHSHLPGFRVGGNDSSDGDLSSIATAITSTRRPPSEIIEEHNSRNTTIASTGVHDTMSRMRNKILAKELWMRDENAKDCFYCGDTFSAFRRKHHCRK
jgi:1-phosphatidylinositol-3-phosphate 5-kinase